MSVQPEGSLKRITCLANIFLAVSLAACGGGSGSDGTHDAGPGPVLRNKLNASPQIVEYYGDSTIWGYQAGTTGDRVRTPAPAAFAAELPSHHEVHNEGVNRTTACDLLEGTNGYSSGWIDKMASSPATVVIINHGINDMYASYGVPRYRQCLSQLVDVAKGRGKVVILETPNPVLDGGDEPQTAYVQAMREVAAQKATPLIDQYQYLTQYMEERNLTLGDICPDGVHPSEEIYIEKGRFAAREFKAFDSP